MAVFNPDQSHQPATDYTNESKGYKPNTAFADLFQGAAGLGFQAIKVKDQSNLLHIQQQAHQGVDAANAEWLGDQSTDTQGTPQDIAKYAKTLETTKKAYQNGVLRDSQYQQRIDSLSRQIRARYPGYRDEIDGIVRQTLGLSTANDVRKQMMAEWSAEQENTTAEERAFRSEVTAGRKDGVLPPQYDIREASGNPYSMAETRAFMAAKYQQRADMEESHKKYEAIKDKNEYTKNTLKKTANRDIMYMSMGVWENAFSASGMSMQSILKGAQEGKLPGYSQEDRQTIVNEFAKLKSNMSSQFWAKLNTEPYNDLTYEEKKDIVAAGMAQADVIENQLKDEKFGLLNFAKTMNDTMIQSDIYNWMINGDPVVRQAKMLNTFSDGNIVMNEILMKTPDLGTGLQTAVTQLMTGELFNKDQKSLIGVIKDGQNKQGGELEPQVIKQVATNAIQLLLTKDISPELAEQGAKILFSEENQAMLGEFSDRSQVQLFNAMINPRMTERIAELSKSDPQIGVNYRNWVLNAFPALFKKDIATINDMARFSDNLVINWNAEKGKFEEGVVPGAEGRSGMVPALGQQYQEWANSAAKASMENLNKYIAQLKPIVEAEGGTAEEALTAIFEKAGIGKQQNQGSLFFRLYSALGKGIGKIDQSKIGGRYGNAINPPNPELNGIDLEGGGKMSSGSKLKDTIAKAEGGKSYNTRFGGAEDIELSNYDVGDVIEMGKMFGKKTGSSAMGKYQFMADTLKRLVDLGIVQEGDMFTPKLQEKMADYLIAEASSGEQTREGKAKKLAKVWAGLPRGPENKSVYDGDGVNKSTIGWDEYLQAF